AGALDALLGDEAVRQAMGRAGRTDAARRFGAGAAAARYAELYRRVLRERATR
ncbi:MAG: hypothetical protein JWL60_385, partial [Gemmatimonadetes bacterium]|nr:hypothetical protein [Gemmatimonadota bacterium]